MEAAMRKRNATELAFYALPGSVRLPHAGTPAATFSPSDQKRARTTAPTPMGAAIPPLSYHYPSSSHANTSHGIGGPQYGPMGIATTASPSSIRSSVHHHPLTPPHSQQYHHPAAMQQQQMYYGLPPPSPSPLPYPLPSSASLPSTTKTPSASPSMVITPRQQQYNVAASQSMMAPSPPRVTAPLSFSELKTEGQIAEFNRNHARTTAADSHIGSMHWGNSGRGGRSGSNAFKPPLPLAPLYQHQNNEQPSRGYSAQPQWSPKPEPQLQAPIKHVPTSPEQEKKKPGQERTLITLTIEMIRDHVYKKNDYEYYLRGSQERLHMVELHATVSEILSYALPSQPQWLLSVQDNTSTSFLVENWDVQLVMDVSPGMLYRFIGALQTGQEGNGLMLQCFVIKQIEEFEEHEYIQTMLALTRRRIAQRTKEQ
ncbi:hypothetical protein QOT17_013490 [Balamuthia mandrillaris]